MDATEDTEPARPDPTAMQPIEPADVDTPQGATLSDDPAMPDAFRAVVRPLDDLANRPVDEHAERYDDVHRTLRAALDDVDTTR